jgi:hypothetical protein
MAWWNKADSGPRDLTEAEFAELTGRIVDIAVNETTVSDAITATAKALGSLIGIASRRPEISFESMLQTANEAVELYAKEAVGRDQIGAESTANRLQKATASFIDIITTNANPTEIRGAAIALSSLAGFMVGFASVRGDDGNMRPHELLTSCAENFQEQAEKHRQSMLSER